MKKYPIVFIRQFRWLIASAYLSLQCLTTQSTEPEVKIHYLGHSSFVIEFDNGITMVTDYGHYNAWVDYGWDSPIKSFNDLVPDVMTYSHKHDDHYDASRIPTGVGYILTDLDTLEIDGIKIKPLRTCEENINTESNSSYFIYYKGLKICHLGDAQAQIINIAKTEVRNHIKELFPDTLDLLFMTIDGQQQFIPQAEDFVKLLHPKRIIPMHHWSESYLQQFIDTLESKNIPSDTSYFIEQIAGPVYSFSGNDMIKPIHVVKLQRAEYKNPIDPIRILNSKPGLTNPSVYPVPFTESATVSFTLDKPCLITITVYDLLGRKVETIANGYYELGSYQFKLDGSGLKEGGYFLKLQTSSFEECSHLIFIR
jgi:L-ascorbate metabolism protein UlaG (beta-lactamase superfamily)